MRPIRKFGRQSRLSLKMVEDGPPRPCLADALGSGDLFNDVISVPIRRRALVRGGRTHSRTPDRQTDEEVAKQHGNGADRADLLGEQAVVTLLQYSFGGFDADGRYLLAIPQTHIPHFNPRFLEKFYFVRSGNLGYRVLIRRLPAIGRLYLLRPAFFPEGAGVLEELEWI